MADEKKKIETRVAICSAAGAFMLALAIWINAAMRRPHLPATPEDPFVNVSVAWVWGWTAALTVIFLALVGMALKARPAGLLIDARNRISLSRLQMAAWTVLIVSALVTLAAARMAVGAATPLSIDIPPELIVAMGIAAGSAVTAPALLNLKASGDAAAPVANPPVQAAAAQPPGGQQPAAVTPVAMAAQVALDTGRDRDAAVVQGTVLGWASAKDAQWMDMFRGEEASDGGAIDLAKVQQFLITLLLVGIYAAAIWALLSGAGYLSKVVPAPGKAAASLPPLYERFIWLMGISHAGYLTSKALPSAGAGNAK